MHDDDFDPYEGTYGYDDYDPYYDDPDYDEEGY